MPESLIVSTVTIFTLAILALVFMFFYFRSVHEEIRQYWMVLSEKLGVRLDKIPNLIETLQGGGFEDAQLIEDLVEARAESWPIVRGKERVHAELKITEMIHKAWEATKHHEELNRNTNFLELKMEFKEIGREIEEMGEVYNHKVRKYNQLVGIFGLSPVLGLMGFRKLPVFEFES